MGSTISGKLLVVDDQRSFLQSYERAFFDSPITVFAAVDPETALKILGEEEIDIVVADFRMPGMNGVLFLKQVKSLHPTVHRVLSSGFLDRTIVQRFLSTGSVSTFIAKPWEDRFLVEKIGHIINVKRRLSEGRLLELINSIESLPTLPGIYEELLEAVESEKSMQEIADVLRKDPAVATSVLHVVNSAFFGRENVTSVRDAAVELGIEVIKDIVLSAALVGKGQWNQAQMDSLKNVFLHSFMVNKYVPPVHRVIYRTAPEGLPSAGIVHDIGKILMLAHLFDRYQSVCEYQVQNAETTFWASEHALGFEGNSHAELGAYLLDWWNFPEVMVEVALFHHCPEHAHTEYQQILAATHHTDRIVNAVWFGQSGEAAQLLTSLSPGVTGELAERLVSRIEDDLAKNREVFDGFV